MTTGHPTRTPLEAVCEGRIDSLADAVDLLSGCRDLGIGRLTAAFRDRRDAAAAVVMLDDAPDLSVLDESALLPAMRQAYQLLRRRADGGLTLVQPPPEKPPASARLCVVTRPGPRETAADIADRMAGALLAPGVAVVVIGAGPALDLRTSPLLGLDTLAALPAMLARLGADRVQLIDPAVRIGPAYAAFTAVVAAGGDATAAWVPPVAISRSGRLTGIWHLDTAAACVGTGALSAMIWDDPSVQWPRLLDAIRRYVRTNGQTIEPEAVPVLERPALAPLRATELIAIAAEQDAAALLKAIVFTGLARTGRLATVLSETLPEMLESLPTRLKGRAAVAKVCDEAAERAGSGELFTDLGGGRLDCGLSGQLVMRPDLAFDLDRYLCLNPDVMLRIARGERLDPLAHLLGEGALEGRDLTPRVVARVSVHTDAAANDAIARWLEAPLAEAPLALAPPPGIAARLIADGRLTAAAAEALDTDNGASALVPLARLGLGTMLWPDGAGLPRGETASPRLAHALIDHVLPLPSPDRPEPAFVTSLAGHRTASVVLRAVDAALQRADYDVARDRLAALQQRKRVPVTDLLPRLHAAAEWPAFIRAARSPKRAAFDRHRDEVFGRAYLGQFDAEAIDTGDLDPAHRAFFEGCIRFLRGDIAACFTRLEESLAHAALPYTLHILIGLHARAGRHDVADDLFFTLAMLDARSPASQLALAQHFERIGAPKAAIRLMRESMRTRPTIDWMRAVTLFYLYRLFNFDRRPGQAAQAALAFRAHAGIGSVMNEPEYRQATVSIGVFTPWLAPLMKTAPVPQAAPLPAFDVPDDPGISEALAIVDAHPGHEVFVVAFQTGDTYLFLYCLSEVRARMDREGRQKPILIIAPQRMKAVVELFQGRYDTLAICEIGDFFRLNQALHDRGASGRVRIGHYEYLHFGHDGEGREGPHVMPYLLALKSGLGLSVDFSGSHPDPALLADRLPLRFAAPAIRPRAFLAPSANSMPLLPPALWRVVVRQLQRRGFDVFINRGPGEPGLDTGAEELSLDHAALLATAHGFDLIIGLRSGLLDILSGFPGRLVEIYNGPVHAAPFLHIWELAPLRPGRDTRVVRLVERHDSERRAVRLILAAALDP